VTKPRDPCPRFARQLTAVGHLAFGHGIHYCVGAPLARFEAETALSRLLERFGTIHLGVSADDLRWRSSTLHGLRELPVRVER
jgi:cytochrome P450